MGFGQAVIGPPGSGKSTYCWGLQQYFKAISRPLLVINLDPGVEELPYEASIDIRDLIKQNEVMEFNKLGPNGSILFCLEYLESHFDWFSDKLTTLTAIDSSPGLPSSSSSSSPKDRDPSIDSHRTDDPHLDGSIDYIVLDLPGQVEISTDHDSLKNVLHKLEKLDWRLAVVQLTDSTHIIDPTKYISIVLLNLKTMLHLGLPQVNVLTKIDLLKHFGDDFKLKLEFYTDVQDLSYLLPILENQISKRFTKLNQAIIELIEDFNLVGFETLCVEDKLSMTKLNLTIDKALGYYPSNRRFTPTSWENLVNTGASRFDGAEPVGEMMIESDLTQRSIFNGQHDLLNEVQERWIDHPDLYDQFQRELWANEAESVARNATRLEQIQAIRRNQNP